MTTNQPGDTHHELSQHFSQSVRTCTSGAYEHSRFGQYPIAENSRVDGRVNLLLNGVEAETGVTDASECPAKQLRILSVVEAGAFGPSASRGSKTPGM
jgi:hypothetical protein